MFGSSKVWMPLHNNKVSNKLHYNPYPNDVELKSCILNGDLLCTKSIALKYSQDPEVNDFACNFLLNYWYKNSLKIIGWRKINTRN